MSDLARNQIKAKKHFGQNFLVDNAIKNKIIEAIPKEFVSAQGAEFGSVLDAKNLAEVTPKLQLIEIGPGLGDLTKRLLEIAPLRAFEIDQQLCSLIAKQFEFECACGRLELINADALNFCADSNFEESSAKKNAKKSPFWLSKMPYFLVSNLPYYVATAIILKALRDPLCAGFLVMTQKEVAEKFCASTNDSNFCALSVLARTLSTSIELLFDVPPNAFNPAPKVTSSVFRVLKKGAVIESKMESKTDSTIDSIVENLSSFEVFLKISFSAPRKKLLAVLKPHFARTQAVFNALKIDSNSRPHQLNTNIYHQLFLRLKEQ